MTGKFILCIALLFLSVASGAQSIKVTLSGLVKDVKSKTVLPFVNVTLQTKDSVFVAGTISREDGRFTLPDTP